MKAVTLALVLLASTHGKAKKHPPPPVPSVVVDPGAASAAAKALGISTDLVTRVEKFAGDADRVSKGSTDDALCSLVGEAASLGEDIHVALPSADPAKAAELEKDAPGLLLGLQGKAGAKYALLAKVAAAKHASAATLLAGSGAMLDAPHPVFIVMKTADQGCTDYSKALDPIQSIVKGWKSAPACLKKVLKGPLSAALADDSLPNCWCADADHAAYDTRAYAHYLSELEDFSGHDKARVIKAEVDDGSANFSCNAP